MFGFHKPKMYRSIDGCCICRAKSSSSRFTDSKRYEMDFKSCFGLSEPRCGDICNACVLLVKRSKKLPVGSKKNWNHVVDAKAGSSTKATLRTKKMKKKKKVWPSQISRVQSELKRNNSDAHSTTSSASPAQSPSYSNQSDEGSDTELSPNTTHSPAFSFLDLTYWKRQKVCCGIVYKGRYGEVIIDPHLYKPCCQRKPKLQQPEEEEEEEEQQQQEREEEEEQGREEEEQEREEEEEERGEEEQERGEEEEEEEEATAAVVEQEAGEHEVSTSPAPATKQAEEMDDKEEQGGGAC